jgi:trans-aconitate 2-methyltransferase
MLWEPGQYARFAGPRLRPGLDLLARVPLEGEARHVVDLGCGTGALLPALRARFPEAGLTGVDNSPEMLARARGVDPDATLVEADAAGWSPEGPVDLIFSNAVLHWLPDHAALLPRLLRSCRVLAVQMPANFEAPSHRLVGEIAARPRWASRLGGIRPGEHVLPLAEYRRLLAPLAAEVDLWETVYWHVLEAADPVLEWVRGTTLLPVLAALGGAASNEARAFTAEYAEALRSAYPPEPDGRTLFPFRRLFLVATGA